MENQNLPATQTNSEVVSAEEINAQDTAINVVMNYVSTETKQDKIAFLNALDNADVMLNKEIGTIITIKSVYACTNYSRKKNKQVCRLLIIDDQGRSHATGSFFAMNSLRNIINVFGNPQEVEDPIKVQVCEKDLGEGKNALTFKVVE